MDDHRKDGKKLAYLTWCFTNLKHRNGNWTKRAEHATIHVRKTRESGSCKGFPLFEPTVFTMIDQGFHRVFHVFLHFSTVSE